MQTCGMPSKRACRTMASFGKTESYPTFKHMRSINSRTDEFKCFSGPWIHAIEHEVYKMKNFIKKIPIPDRPGLISGLWKTGAQTIGTDYVGFEALMVPRVMEAIECTVYRYMMQAYPDDCELICAALMGENNGVFRNGTKFTVHGRRMSGDMCTSLGNGLTNLVVFMTLMGERSWDGFVEGDDGIFCVYDNDPLPTPADFEKLGFMIKEELPEHPSEASFCGIVSSGNQNIKDPAIVLQKYGWMDGFFNAGPRVRDQLKRGKALMLAYELPHCPIVRALADRGLRQTQGAAARFSLDPYHSAIPYPRDTKSLLAQATTMQTRALFSKKFGISIDTQFEAEKMLRNGAPLDDCLSAIVAVRTPIDQIHASRENTLYL